MAGHGAVTEPFAMKVVPECRTIAATTAPKVQQDDEPAQGGGRAVQHRGLLIVIERNHQQIDQGRHHGRKHFHRKAPCGRFRTAHRFTMNPEPLA
jgi:hypothetical protein